MRRQGFTMLEWIVAIVAITGLILLVWALLYHPHYRPPHGRYCASNCSAIGKALLIYISDPSNEGAWPWVNGTNWDSPTGTNRLKAPPESQIAPDDRAITSLLWVLVRQNHASVKHFKCPADNSGRFQADCDIDTEHDFADARNVSYSYAAPIPAEGGGWRSGADPSVRQAASVAVLSDRNPMHDGRPVGPWTDDLTDKQRRQRLSGNHDGEAINVVWMDGHTSTEKRADIGVMPWMITKTSETGRYAAGPGDNIYSAGGTDVKLWRQSVSTKLTDHTSAEDSFIIGPYGK